jgi:hypothetical protein
MYEPQLDPSLPPFPRAEKFLRERSEIGLPDLSLADVTADVLGKILERIQLPELDGEPTDAWIQTKALMYLGVLAGRSLRSVVVLLRSGYDSEALVFKRRLDEITARVKRVSDATNGAQHASDWLAGKDRKASSVVELPERSWDLHSHVAHADFEPWSSIWSSAATTVAPTSRCFLTGASKATMIGVMSAVLTRDITYEIAGFKQLAINGDDMRSARRGR